jgi:two-component system, OmpR family, heavy metal sensor histidine kinase CusS
MMISFRTRLFVISGLIVATVLTAVMIIGWTRVLAFEAQRLEQRLCMEARRIATQPFHSEDMPHLITDALNKLHLTSPDQVVLGFEVRAEGENFQPASGQLDVALNAAQWRAAKSGNLVDASDQPRDRPISNRDENLPSQRDQRDNRPAPPKEPPPQQDQFSVSGICTLASFGALGRQWRAARFNAPFGRSVLAVDLAATQADVQSALRQALQMVVPLALVFTAFGAWFLSTLTMRPVNRLSNAMRGITQKALDRRLSTEGEDREFKVLIDAYNTMLARLETSFQQASRFSADASHELKTPLTILQGRIEQALQRTDQPAMQSELTDLLDEVGRLSAITRKLLLLSQVDSGYLALQRIPIDLSKMLLEMAADTNMLLTNQSLECDIDHGLSMHGDEVLLRQLFNNLINNAVRYCRPGGWIKLVASLKPDGIEVVFSNATYPIAANDRAQFFDRFYRGDASRNRRVDGNGLGLSLALEIARIHDGDLTLITSEPEEVVLQLMLPLR